MIKISVAENYSVHYTRTCSTNKVYNLIIFVQHFLEDTDQLWKLHCEREFKGSEPDEFETYRELYLVYIFLAQYPHSHNKVLLFCFHKMK